MNKPRGRKKEETLLQVYNDTLPPNNDEVEKTILGTIMLEKEVIYKFASELNEGLFFNLQCRKVCLTILHLYNDSKPIDILTVTQTARELGYDKEVTAYFVSSLISHIASTAHFESHFRILQQYALKRLMIQACSKGIRESYNEQKDVFDLVSEIQNDVDAAIKGVITYQIENVGSLHQEIIKKSFEIAQSNKQSGVPTGLYLLDNVTNGWQESDLIILAGRPSMGKTAAAISMALYPALQDNIGVGIFSLEMSSEQLTSRMQSILSGVNVGRIVKKQLNIQEIEKVEALAKQLNTAPIYIDDTPNISIQEFKGKARKMIREFGCRLLIVDYLQLMRSGMNTYSREQEIAEISRSLKATAKELNVPIIALSQLSRAVESRGGDKKPLLSDLRESGQIEQDADMVCFCYRPEYYEIEDYEVGGQHFNTKGLFLLLVSKHRNGELGEIPLTFVHEQTKLKNYEYPSFENFEPTNVKQLENNSTFVQPKENTEIQNGAIKNSSWENDLFDKDGDNDDIPF
jgi:replicative DNA helicase